MEAQLCAGVLETWVTAVARTIRFDELVGSRPGGIVAASHGEQDVPTSHARDLVRHGLRRSAFRAVGTAFSAWPWLLLQFACGAGRTQKQPDVSHRQHR